MNNLSISSIKKLKQVLFNIKGNIKQENKAAFKLENDTAFKENNSRF